MAITAHADVALRPRPEPSPDAKHETELIVKNGEVLTDQGLLPLDVAVTRGRIAALVQPAMARSAGKTIDAAGFYVLPGFIDLHTHGGAGIDLMHATEDEIARLTEFYAAQGTTGFLATTLTAAKEETLSALVRMKKVSERGTCGARMLGIHLEGPYITRDFAGAQPTAHIVPPTPQDFAAYDAAAGGLIRLVTLAPEVDGALELISYLRQRGVAVSLGHSGATYKCALAAIAAGACSCTHIFNGMKGLHHHEPGILGACLESEIYSELICDGRHLAPGTVRLLWKTKGIDRLLAVTDSMVAAGLPDGTYWQGSLELTVREGDVRLRDGSRAGSSLTMIGALRNLIKFTGRGLAECVRPLTCNPAALLGIQGAKGGIRQGMDADLVLIDRDYRVRGTIVDGRVVYAAGLEGVG
ncbi:MAG: N-acetylglucosamine-6-phosphate deacetylase [Bacteroidota bacterium]